MKRTDNIILSGGIGVATQKIWAILNENTCVQRFFGLLHVPTYADSEKNAS